MRSWCQHASIFPPKTHQKCIKTWTWKASIFWWIFASIFYWFSFNLGGQLGAMLSSKTRPRRLQEASKMAPKTKCVTFFDFDWILMDFGWIFDGFLIDFDSIFDWFSIDFWSGFWSVFCSFLMNFSTVFDLLARFLVDCSSAVAGTAALLRFG